MAKTRPHARTKRAKGMENPEGSPPQGRGPRGQSGWRTPALHKPARRKNTPRRQRYQELFDFAPDGYLLTDPAGVIQQANRAAVALLNAPSALLVNKPLIVFVAPTERKAFRAQLIHLLQARRVEE